MTQKRELEFDCLFLHDTQMTELEREQTALRQAFGRADPSSPLPFSFLSPFCPASRTPFPGKLTIGAPIVDSFWIVRPVAGLPDSARPSVYPEFPGYPPLPQTFAFVVGYAGERDILRELAGTESFEPFTVNVGFYAGLSVNIDFDEDVAYSVFTRRGDPEWHKAGESL
jgi:hypothetical protein